MKKIILSFTLLFVAMQLNAQNNNNPAVALRGYNDHVFVRFFTADKNAFLESIKNGYVVEKAIAKLGVKNEMLSFQPIAGSPFHRFSEKELEAKIKTLKANDEKQKSLAGFAYAMTDTAVKINSGDLLNNGLQSLKEAQEKSDNMVSMSMIATFRSRLAAEVLGMFADDKNVNDGVTYVYRVRINTTDKSMNEWTYNTVTCKAFDEKYLFSQSSKVKVEEGEQQISFSFPKSNDYFAFSTERSDNDGKTFARIDKQPTLSITPHGAKKTTTFGYNDVKLIDYKKYIYRIWVSTIFGDELLLNEFTAIPRDRTPPIQPSIHLPENVNPNEVKIKWSMSSKPNDLAGFNIYRSADDKDGFKKINAVALSKNETSYIDKTFDKGGMNYYKVEAFDTAGNKSISYSALVTLIDSTPPAKPIISSAIIDSFGKVIIKIKPNTEKDFMGYELQKANSAEHEFATVLQTFNDSTNGKTFVLYDSTTLKSLTKKIFYKVIAFDTHFNQSISSDIIELKRRDTIKPVSALITDFKITDSSTIIYFVNSSSADAAKNLLLRRELGKEKFEIIFTNSNNSITSFSDRNIVAGKTYEYTMQSIDESGLKSKSSRSILLQSIPETTLPTPIVTAEFDSDLKEVKLIVKTNPQFSNKNLCVEIKRKSNLNSSWEDLPRTIMNSNGTFYNSVKGFKSMIYIVRVVENDKASNYSSSLSLTF